MGLTKFAAYVVVGLILQGLSRLVPFRKQENEPEVSWDFGAVFFTLLCTILYGLTFGGPAVRYLANVPAIAEWHALVLTWPWTLMVAINFVLADFANYWAHRFLHSKVLWDHHAWHHAPKHLWWVSGLRGSPVHVFFNILPYSIAYLIFPTTAGGILGMAIALLGIANQHWQHSNIELPHSRKIELLFVTPRFHFVHHSANPKYTNSNYGFLTTIWDRMFNTFTDPDTVPLDEPLGLDYDNSNTRLMLGLPPEIPAAQQIAERTRSYS